MSKKIGRFEYVKRGLVGVCAATMLAGMCAVPAFAAPAEPDSDDYGTTGSTAINSKLDVANISATVPTTLASEIDSEGAITFPTTAELRNTSKLYAISVNSATVTQGSGVNLVASGQTFTDAIAKNSAWVKIGQSGTFDGATADTEVNTDSMANLNWSIPSNGKLALKLDGAIKNVNQKEFAPFLTIVWTVGIDGSAS